MNYAFIFMSKRGLRGRPHLFGKAGRAVGGATPCGMEKAYGNKNWK